MLTNTHENKIITADGTQKCIKNELVCEHHLMLHLNGEHVQNFVCLDQNLDLLIIGWLVSNLFINSIEDIDDIKFDDKSDNAYASIKKSITAFKENVKFKYEDKWIFDLANEFKLGQSVHLKTSGTHCSILSVNGKIKYSVEDLSRRNTIYKTIGYITKNNINPYECIVFSSARITSDIVEILINSKIPVIATKSVITTQAAKLAKGNATLIYKAWPDSFQIA